jgi:hypothetical protein
MTTKYPKRPIRRLPGFCWGFEYDEQSDLKQWVLRNIESADFLHHRDLETAISFVDYSTFVGLVDGYSLRRLLENFNTSYLKLKADRSVKGVGTLTDDLINRLLALVDDLKKLDGLWRKERPAMGERTKMLLHLIRFWKYGEITLIRTELHQRYHSIFDMSLDRYRKGGLAWQAKWRVGHKWLARIIGGVWDIDDASSVNTLDSIDTQSVADAFDSDESDVVSEAEDNGVRSEDLQSEASCRRGNMELSVMRHDERLVLIRKFVMENIAFDRVRRAKLAASRK